jgi:hypothetical protein
MIDVSTGGYPRIADLEPKYKEHSVHIAQELSRRGIPNPNPHLNLRRWYDRWSSGDLPTYKSRRSYVNNMYDPIVKQIESALPVESPLFSEPTGWDRVDRGNDKIKRALETAGEEEDFQSVGLLCREVLISVSQAVFNPEIHVPADGVRPSKTDAKRMLEAYIAVELAGGTDEEARRHARASLDLANALQHRRTASFRDAAMCAEATISVTNLMAIVAKRRKAQPIR